MRAVLPVTLMTCFWIAGALAQAPKYPPLPEYMMSPEAEIALARSAAPDNISAHATIKLLTASGYKVAKEGDNGFVCMVMRGWGAPTFTPSANRNLVYDPQTRAPICFNPVAVRTVMPYQEMRARLAMEGKGPDEIADAIEAAYSRGELPRMETVGFAYMLSADQKLGPAGAWRPHMMVYTPYYTNAMLGGNEGNSGLPVISDDAGTPFAITVIPVDRTLAVKAQLK
ncbi:hypothetical protein [Acidobacterium sp. S8]|uniref:hypothetical protein n=1 Tax=Acidobacterium sp. S8 TaxID=1641854 RepID=UPI00131B45E3|nr:hypothetical protein [Acidobacterium sp. S8]